MRTKQEILDFLDNKLLMTFSTVSEDGRPESAVMGFGHTQNFELVFGTSKLSRKFKNILKNDAVAVVIGWDDSGTIQYEGTARLLEGEEINRYTELYFLKNPTAKQYKDDPDERYFLITPRWLRFTETTSFPWEVTEFTEL